MDERRQEPFALVYNRRMVDDRLPPDGVEVGDPPWDAWHPLEVVERLSGVEVSWCVVAGWALDLFRGETTREHEDLEIAVPAGRFDPIRAALAGFEFGRARCPMTTATSAGQRLATPLPRVHPPFCPGHGRSTTIPGIGVGPREERPQ